MSTETTLSLKEEYALKKAQEKETAYSEAKQLLESHYLIFERLDTATIAQIVDSMAAIEEALAPFLPKLPSVKTGLDAAEAELTKLVSGSSGADPRKLAPMLGKALAFYQHLSSFLRQDLPVLLRSRLVAGAKAQPDAPVGPKLVPVFKQALAQEKTGGFLKRLFSSSNIPYINNDSLASELATLTFEELTKLSQVGKAPAVMPQAVIDKMAAQAAGSSGEPAPAPTSGTTPTSSSGGKADLKAKVQKALSPWVTTPDAVDAVVKALSQ
jgi:hypothetical protein